MVDDYVVDGIDSGVDLAADADAEPGEQETTEVVEVTSETRPFLSTPFQDYTVTEGLLFCLVLSVVAVSIVKIVKWGFSWLL